jgi:AraC family transcriptional regulator
MGVTQMIHGYGQTRSDNQTSYTPATECSSLAVVTGFLDAALRMWDGDGIQAKSQVKVAAAILRGYTGGSVADEILAASAPDKCTLAPWQTRKVREYIEASLESPIRVQECAEQARLSVSYFSHAFKATFGMTVGHYIRRRRIERAQQLMLLSKVSLSQIALACGFADQAHYCKVFRAVVGLSPSAWRRGNSNLAPDE